MICATSNWAPQDLFHGGHNRALFKPFIKSIEQVFNIVSLGDGTDYRRGESPEGIDKLPHVYVGEGHDLRGVFDEFSAKTALDDSSISVIEATLKPVAHSENVLHATFKELCGSHVAAEHYTQLAKRYHTFIVEDIPMLDAEKQAAAMRFVILVDILYENGNALVLQTAKTLDELNPEGESSFAFDRTISRIVEMQGRLS